MKRKICIVTGSRAEYGLLRWVIQGIHEDSELTLQLIVTGMHLSPEFGLTYREIEQDGFKIDFKIETLLSSDTAIGVTKSMGLGMIGFAEALSQLKPNLILVLGDRFEIFCAVSAAMIAKIPVAHLHGGERTEGAFDESIRHCITKMSHLHFVAAEEYRRRVVQLGEQPEHVFLVGALGIDGIKKQKLLEKSELEEAIGFKFGCKNLLITFHPVTLDNTTSRQQMSELLGALKEFPEINLIFTMPNADTEGRVLMRMIQEFIEQNKNAQAYASLGQLRYLSCLKYVDGVVGNSSSGLTEVPAFKKGTVNIGDRQQGRLKTFSVIDCFPERNEIKIAINRLYSLEFQSVVQKTQNPYDCGGATEQIVKIVKNLQLEGIQKKIFFDL